MAEVSRPLHRLPWADADGRARDSRRGRLRAGRVAGQQGGDARRPGAGHGRDSHLLGAGDGARDRRRRPLPAHRPHGHRARQHRRARGRPSAASSSPTCRTTACARSPSTRSRSCSPWAARWRRTIWRRSTGKYDLVAELPVERIEGKTLGIVGLGQIGSLLAAKAAALGMRVVGTNRSRQAPAGRRVAAARRAARRERLRLAAVAAERRDAAHHQPRDARAA